MGASSSNYSEWNIDDKWSSQEWKSDEMLEARTGRPVGGQQFTQDTDKFVIDDQDMDSDTARESNLSLKSRSFLHRVNDRLRKIWDHSSEDAIQDIDKRSLVCGMFTSSTLEASVFMRKDYSENLHSIKKKNREWSHFETDVWHIWKVDSRTIRWDFWSVSNQLGRFSMETLIFGQWWRNHQSLACKGLCIFGFCVMSWKSESEPNIKYCLGRKVELVQRFATVQNSGHNWRRADGIRVEYFPRIHHIAAHHQSPRVHDQNERPITIQRTNYLHVDIQWHHMVIWRQWTGMHCKRHTCDFICKKISTRTRSFLGPGPEKKWYSN